jgi:hypothetical protein
VVVGIDGLFNFKDTFQVVQIELDEDSFAIIFWGMAVRDAVGHQTIHFNPRHIAFTLGGGGFSLLSLARLRMRNGYFQKSICHIDCNSI